MDSIYSSVLILQCSTMPFAIAFPVPISDMALTYTCARPPLIMIKPCYPAALKSACAWTSQRSVDEPGLSLQGELLAML